MLNHKQVVNYRCNLMYVLLLFVIDISVFVVLLPHFIAEIWDPWIHSSILVFM